CARRVKWDPFFDYW
nr:immunoglobulin heavy chain junction region [Mus musculus]